MAHYNLYKSLGLDRDQASIALCAELDRRISSGATSNPGGQEELEVARAILGDPARRSVYDFQLDDHNAPDITVAALRQLAAMDLNPPELDDDEVDPEEDATPEEETDAPQEAASPEEADDADADEEAEPEAPEPEAPEPEAPEPEAPEPEAPEPEAPQPEAVPEKAEPDTADKTENADKPQQHFPITSPNLPVVEQIIQPPQARPAPARPAPAGAKQWSVLPWLIAIVATLLLAGVGAYWYVRFGATDPWAGREARLARTFPDLISQREGGRGFEGMTCSAKQITGDEVSKIRCVNKTQGVSIVEFDSNTQRNSALPEGAQVERFGNGACQINSIQLPDQATPAYLIAPEEPLDRYLFMVNGNEAEQLRVRLPIC